MNLSVQELTNKALKLHQEGQINLAEEIYRSLLDKNPKDPLVLSLMGTIFIQKSKPKEALSFFHKSLKLDSSQPLTFGNLAVAEYQLKRYESSLKNFNLAIKLQPNYAEAFNNRGNVLRDLGRNDEALDSYNKAALINPNLLDVYVNRGDFYRKNGDIQTAIKEYEIALRIDSSCISALKKCGDLYYEYSLFDKAIIKFEKLLEIEPNEISTIFSCAICYQQNNKLDKALQLYDCFISLDKNNLDALNNKAFIFQSLGDYDKALEIYNNILKLNQHHSSALLNIGIIELTRGNFKDGWNLYEYRWKSVLKDFSRNFNKPQWNHLESIKGKTLLINAEQGFGDVIQFCRYLKLIKELDAKIIIELPSQLVSLISSIKCDFKIIEKGTKLPSFDFYCPVMSLPSVFKTEIETIPASTPYLFSNKDKRLFWSDKLRAFKKNKIGLAYSGSVTHRNNINRSIPLNKFESILELPFDFFILQKELDVNDQELVINFSNLHALNNEINDFSDTAALIEEMDLVISVDTSVAHLSGALAKETWTLIPYVPDFRWMLDRTDSPWYPEMKLFRQDEKNNWDSCLKNIYKKLVNKYLS